MQEDIKKMQLSGNRKICFFMLLISAGTYQANNAWAAVEANDLFGYGLTSGDFNGDGHVDVAVGVLGQDIGGVTNPGAVKVFFGGAKDFFSRNDANVITIQQNHAIVPDSNEAHDNFGEALAAGDFNGDGITDLVIAAPVEDFGAGDGQGQVTVLYGARGGGNLLGPFTFPRPQIWNLNSSGVPGTAASGDWFGDALAVGDFNCDRVDDLAIGAPRALNLAGSVTVLYGSRADGLTSTGAQTWQLANLNLVSPLPALATFGSSLDTGDFNADRCADLAVGAPTLTVSGKARAGAVAVIFGRSAGGLSAAGSGLWHQDRTDVNGAINGVAEADDQFGWSVAVGDFDGNGFDDLAAGAAFEDVGAVNSAGAVNIIYSFANTVLSTFRNQIWDQNTAGIADSSEESDAFGSSLAAGSFTGNSLIDDLAIGVPRENVSSLIGAGMVHVLYGNFGSGLSSANSQAWSQNNLSGVAPEAMDIFGSTLAVTRYRNELNSNLVKSDDVLDLLVGVPRENIGATADAGLVHFIRGVRNHGLTGDGNINFTDAVN